MNTTQRPTVDKTIRAIIATLPGVRSLSWKQELDWNQGGSDLRTFITLHLCGRVEMRFDPKQPMRAEVGQLGLTDAAWKKLATKVASVINATDEGVIQLQEAQADDDTRTVSGEPIPPEALAIIKTLKSRDMPDLGITGAAGNPVVVECDQAPRELIDDLQSVEGWCVAQGINLDDVEDGYTSTAVFDMAPCVVIMGVCAGEWNDDGTDASLVARIFTEHDEKRRQEILAKACRETRADVVCDVVCTLHQVKDFFDSEVLPALLKEFTAKDTRLEWEKNEVQFPRLLSEILAVGLTPEQYSGLATSMDLERGDLDELLDRADTDWQAIKAKL